MIPQCYISDLADCPKSSRLIGFCDASTKAYAVVACLRIEGETQMCMRFVAAKAHVAPLGGMTIPSLELLYISLVIVKTDSQCSSRLEARGDSL